MSEKGPNATAQALTELRELATSDKARQLLDMAIEHQSQQDRIAALERELAEAKAEAERLNAECSHAAVAIDQAMAARNEWKQCAEELAERLRWARSDTDQFAQDALAAFDRLNAEESAK